MRAPIRRIHLEDARRDRLYFAQVREDPLLELAFLEPRPEATYVVVGSGGCTVLSLLGAGAGRVVAVDVNQTQNDLLELKLQAVIRLEREAVLAFLGGAPSAGDRWMTYQRIRGGLTDGARQYWDAQRRSIRVGVLAAGVTERMVRFFVRMLQATVHGRRTIEELLTQSSLEAQDSFYRERWNTRRWRLLVRLLLSRGSLKRTYDPAFFRGVEEEDFATHFQRQIEHVLRRLPVGQNYFLHHMLRGEYPRGVAASLPPYLEPPGADRIRAGVGTLEVVDGAYTTYLESCPARSIHGYVVSNIAEWLSPRELKRLLSQILRTAAPGARLCFRNFVGWTEVPQPFRAEIREDQELGEELMRTDRSLVQRRFAPCHLSPTEGPDPRELARVRAVRQDDDDALRRLAAVCPMRGDVEICAEREPNFFELTRLEGLHARVAVTADEDDRPVSCITAAERLCYRNGEMTRIVHAGDLKVHPSFRDGQLADALSAWTIDHVGDRLGKCGTILCTVLAGNRPMERRLPGSHWIPTFSRVGTIRTHSIPVIGRRRLKRTGLTVERARASNFEEMSEVWARVAPLRQFTPAFDAQGLAEWVAQAPNLDPTSYLLARDARGNLVGFMGLWDQRAFKQLRVIRYSRRMRAFRRAFNPLTPLLAAKPLPPAGALMRCATAVHVCVPPDQPNALRALLVKAHETALEREYAFFNVSLDRDDPLTPALRGFLAQPTDVHVYLTSPVGRYAGPELDGRPLHYETALV